MRVTSLFVIAVGIGLGAATGCSSDDDASTRAASVRDCKTLCDLTPSASVSEGNCAALVLTNRGYPVAFTDECLDVNETSECNECYQVLGTNTDDCLAIRDECVEN